VKHAFSRVDFAVDDCDAVQRELNELHGYARDIPTKVMHRNRLNLFVLLVRRLIERRLLTRFDAALDVGCGTGVYASVLADLGFRSIVGVDVDETSISVARRRFGDVARFEARRAEDLDPEDRFDLVLCTEVIEHTDDPSAVAANLKRALAPGGVAVVSVPNAWSLPFVSVRTVERLRGRALDADLRDHLKFPAYRTLRLLEGPGLRRIATDGTNLFLDPKTLRLLYGTRAFVPVNRANFALARLWPLRYASQFFFVAVKRDD
jgi:2-polyprenyl-3-methyl-5-hydroxy-6-metoxy-1,4-benzoquinol methylase